MVAICKRSPLILTCYSVRPPSVGHHKKHVSNHVFYTISGDVRSLSPERSPIAMKDVKWLTQNCTVGFLVAGMWNNRYYSNSAAIISTSTRSTGHDMLASGDADGYIRLFR